MINREESSSMDFYLGWAGIIFFGLGIILGIKQLFDKKVQIEIDENGVWDKTLRTGKIDWKYIKGAYPINIMDSHFISLILDEEYESKILQYGWATKLSNEVGAQKVNLNLVNIKANSRKVAEIITKTAEMDLNSRAEYLKNVHNSLRN